MTARSYLSENLRACFGDLIEDERMTEIAVNADGSVWIERVGDPAMQRAPLTLDPPTALKLGHDVAGESPVSKTRTLAGSEFFLGASLWRAQVVAPPTVESGFSVALRRAVSDHLPLSRLCAGVNMKSLIQGEDDAARRVFEAFDAGNFQKFITRAVLAKWNILFSGGTSSGKTTWARACLDVVPEDERILTIEDVYELRPKHPNCLAMRSSEAATPSDLLKACLRLRPDRVIMGELRGAEAFDFLSVVNSGHGGTISTLHADSPEGALYRLANMVMQAGMGKEQGAIIEECRRAIHVVIQLGRVAGARQPTGIEIFMKRPSTRSPVSIEAA